MFPFNIILVNPKEEELRSWYVKLQGTSIPVYMIDFAKSKTEIHFVSNGINLDLQISLLKYLADKHPGAPILLLETSFSVENMAKPKLIVKEWKNGEITIKEKNIKSNKAEDFAFVNDLPEEMINQFLNVPIEPPPTTAQPAVTTQVNTNTHTFTWVGTPNP